MSNTVLKLATVATLVAVIGGIAGARTSVSMCNDKEFYSEHVRMCQLWFEYGIKPRRHGEQRVAHHPRPPVDEFPAVVSYEMRDQSVTVQRDHQSGNDFRPDQYIVVQTAADVARSNTTSGFAGWFVSVFDLGKKHPPIYAQATRRDRQQAGYGSAAPAKHPSSEGYGGGYYNAHPN